MHPIVQVQLGGKGAAVLLLLLLAALAALSLVWLIFGIGPAIAGGIGLVLLIRGALALFKTPE